MFMVDCHTCGSVVCSETKSHQNKPRAQASLANRNTRKQCCEECGRVSGTGSVTRCGQERMKKNIFLEVLIQELAWSKFVGGDTLASLLLLSQEEDIL